MYKDEDIPPERKIFYNWEDVYNCKKLSSEREAESYKVRVLKEIKKNGLKSDYIKTQYYCSFDIQGNRFITMEQMREANILIGKIEENIIDLGRYGTKDKTYKIAGFDPATTNDYAALVTAIATVSDNRIVVQVKNCYLLNKNIDKISPEKLVAKVATICNDQQIDMIMVDATANQEDRSYYLFKKLLELGCNTYVIPYSYGNMNKMKMMGYLEDSIINRNIILPREEYGLQNEAYQELLDELCYLEKKKVESSGKITYKAPEGSIYFDDFAMALAQVNYLCYYVKMQMKNKKIINLGDGIRYPLKFNANKSNFSEDIRVRRSSHYYF